ncbi:hypothetical protein BH10ACT1_BH10ACT1_18800 [soil metagenome]
MTNRKIIGAAAMTAALAAGGLAGAVLGNPITSGAQDGGSTTTTAPATTGQPGPPKGGPGGRGFGGGMDLTVAAKALGVTEEELRSQLQDGKSLADVAKAEGVDKQKLIDALVTAGEKRLAEAKAALPDRVAELVDGTFPAPGPGGGRGGPGKGRGQDLAVAAKTLGVTEDELRTQLQDGKSLADVAKAEGVDEQKLIDALVAAEKDELAAAVKRGDLTQAQADERSADLAARIQDRVEDTHHDCPGRGGHGGGRPYAPTDGGN